MPCVYVVPLNVLYCPDNASQQTPRLFEEGIPGCVCRQLPRGDAIMPLPRLNSCVSADGSSLARGACCFAESPLLIPPLLRLGYVGVLSSVPVALVIYKGQER